MSVRPAALARLVDASEAARKTRSRLAKTDAFADALGGLSGEEVEIAVGLLTGRLRQGKVGMGPASVRAARPGSAADGSELTLDDVDQTLTTIQSIAGKGSKAAKQNALCTLLSRATREEQAFLLRALLGELRQGALDGLLLDAVAKAADLPKASVRRGHMLGGELRDVARIALVDGAAGLAAIRLELFRPILPMLAKPTPDLETAVGSCRAEGDAPVGVDIKFDGARIQVHKEDDRVAVYSRGLRDVTRSLPELVETVRGLSAQRLMLDGEAIALYPDGRPFPFQDTMRRFGRTRHVERKRGQPALQPRFFDCLWMNDEILLDSPQRDRWRALDRVVPAELQSPRTLCTDVASVEAVFRRALDQGHEGVMIKRLDAPYDAGRRGAGWFKAKQAHTLDLVVLACEWGSGRRKGWLSNLHLGARETSTGEFVMLGKTFKGLTDALLAWQTEALLALETHRDGHCVYVRPELVLEVALDGVQESPHYPAGMALRFARVKRYREDKTAADADTVAAVREIFDTSRGAAS